jgi:deoxyribodipyrimidine photo-lyase
MEKRCIFWFRRDLRLVDNVGLFHALDSGCKVLPIFIFDTAILDKLSNKKDLRVNFIHQQIGEMQKELATFKSGIEVLVGKPEEIFPLLLKKYAFASIYCNHDYEPYARERDKQIESWATNNQITFKSFKDQCIFEKDEICKDDGKPYTVFTPYSKKWKKALINSNQESIPAAFQSHASEDLLHNCENNFSFSTMPSLSKMGFEANDYPFPGKTVSQDIIKNYTQNRNFPGISGTTQLGIHFRFGTISIREKARKALKLNETFLNELIWRDFYMQILWHFPHVTQSGFKPAYNKIEWLNNENDFEAWCAGKTGYPIVDAGMRELNKTGFMHNRVRMIVASFLCKHLLIDWKLGEQYFAEKLLDFDLSANNGGWQWASGSGTDAAPYFRVFNPQLQTEKFDKQLTYIKKWVPEYGTSHYPKPIVEHTFARNRCLSTYKKGLA